ncbi:MAG: GWxTD domain-containing protein [Candidatus Kapaibacterium sp.]
MRSVFLGFLFGILTYCSAHADGPRFGYDIAQFRDDSGRVRVDFSVGVSDTQFVYKKDSGRLKGRIDFLVVALVGIDTVFANSTRVESSVSGTSDIGGRVFTSRQSMSLRPGQYTMVVTATDRQRPSRTEQIRLPLIVRPFPSTGMSLSDLLICSVAPTDSTRTAVSRAAIDVVPSKEINCDMPVLRTYVEIYQVPGTTGDSVIVQYAISDAVRRPILDMNRTIALSGTVTRDVFEQQVHILPSGVYYVTAGIVSTDGTPAPTNQSTKKFYILNPAYPPELSDLFTEDQLFLASEFAAMSAEAIQEEYEKAKRVGPDIELVSFQQLSTLNAKQKFIFRYWYHKDPNPTTAVNERYEDFKKAVDYAKLNFSNPFTPRGWDSDRGRIVLRYGFPTNINRVIFNHDAAFPHETWEYDNIQGGVIFVFVDKRGSGNVTLVHSTALNEHRDDLWYRRYAIDPSQNK